MFRSSQHWIIIIYDKTDMDSSRSFRSKQIKSIKFWILSMAYAKNNDFFVIKILLQRSYKNSVEFMKYLSGENWMRTSAVSVRQTCKHKINLTIRATKAEETFNAVKIAINEYASEILIKIFIVKISWITTQYHYCTN